MNMTFPLCILIIDVAIIAVLIKSFIKYRHKIHTGDISIHTARNFNICRLLLIANTFAFITAFWQYIVFHHDVEYVILFGRFADRYVMFFAYLALDTYEDNM
jgi:hypothetical protein